MTETSMFWQGTSVGDSGTYDDNVFWDMMYLFHRGSGAECDTDVKNLGIYYSYKNKLEVSLVGVLNYTQIETGAALIDGTAYINSAAFNLLHPAAVTNPRIDYIVLRKNYSSTVTYSPGAGSADVGPYECRITRIEGVEAVAPIAPALIQDTARLTYWDIPIATVQVSTAAPVLSNVVNKREYMDIEEKTVFFPALAGYNVTDVAEINLSGTSTAYYSGGIELPDTKEAFATGRIMIPNDFAVYADIKTIIASTVGAGDAYIKADLSYAACDEALNTHTDTDAYSAETMVSNEQYCTKETEATSATALDVISATLTRDATNVLDTVAGSVHVLGFYLTYWGWKI